jgi:poly-beta-1,6-N-acetyl-D-glucosamine synthase
MISSATSISPVPTADVCVVIPAFNEETLIGRCIQSVLDAGLLPGQIVVVDDCSSDRTADALDRFSGIHVLRNPERLGKVRGIERAIERYSLQSTYRYLSILDADSHVHPLYFDAVVRAFRANPSAVLVCGAPQSERGNWITAYRALEYFLSAWIYRPGQHAAGVITVAPGCASTYHTSILPALDWRGGTLVEDMDLTIQVHRQRLGDVVYVPQAISYTQDPRRVTDYVGQITRWYSGAWQVMRLRRLPVGRQCIDIEFGLIAAEGLVYSALSLALPFLLFVMPDLVWRWMALDLAVVITTAAVCAVHLRRPDVLLCSPTFAVLRLIGAFLWLRTFWTEIVRQRTLSTWFSPRRYQGKCRPAHTGSYGVINA